MGRILDLSMGCRRRTRPLGKWHFMGEHGEVIGVELFDATDDSVARARAEQLVVRVGYRAVEVWDYTVMIYRAERQSKHRPTTGSKQPLK